MDVGSFLHGHSVDHPALCHRDLGSDPAHWMINGRFPIQGGTADIRETSLTTGIWNLVLPPSGGGYVGSGTGGDGNLHIQAPEYGRSVYLGAKYS